MDTILEVRELTKHYEDFSLRGISLEINRGTIAGFFGANGAGKSTLLKVLAHQAPPQAGTVRVFGKVFADAEQELKNRIGCARLSPTATRPSSSRPISPTGSTTSPRTYGSWTTGGS